MNYKNAFVNADPTIIPQSFEIIKFENDRFLEFNLPTFVCTFCGRFGVKEMKINSPLRSRKCKHSEPDIFKENIRQKFSREAAFTDHFASFPRAKPRHL